MKPIIKPLKTGLPSDKSHPITGTARHFEKEKRKLVDLLNSFSAYYVAREKHPVFGKLTKEQWSRATWNLIDYHLQQFGA